MKLNKQHAFFITVAFLAFIANGIYYFNRNSRINNLVKNGLICDSIGKVFGSTSKGNKKTACVTIEYSFENVNYYIDYCSSSIHRSEQYDFEVKVEFDCSDPNFVIKKYKL